MHEDWMMMLSGLLSMRVRSLFLQLTSYWTLKEKVKQSGTSCWLGRSTHPVLRVTSKAGSRGLKPRLSKPLHQSTH